MRELNLFTDPKFRVSLLDPFATWNPRLTGMFFLNIFIAPYTFGKAAAKFAGTPGRALVYALPFVFTLFLFIILHICAVVVDGLWSLAWISFLGYAGKGDGKLILLPLSYNVILPTSLFFYVSLFLI